MRYKRWKTVILTAGMSLMLLSPVTVLAEKEQENTENAESTESTTIEGNWKLDHTGWWYQLESGGYLQDCKVQIGDQVYLFNKEGYMVTGWGWINEKCYYFDAGGAMLRSQWIDDYYVDEAGVWDTSKVKPKWIQDHIGWWYRHEDGSYTRNEFEDIGGMTYYFDSNGYMVTGWYWIDEKCYYFDASGSMLRSQWIDDYYVDENGVWDTSKVKPKWIQDHIGWWYRHEDGSYTKSGFEDIGGRTYYFDADGYMVTGLNKLGENYYYFNPAGDMVKNQYMNNTHIDENGVVTLNKGWNQFGGNWVYVKENGELAVDFLLIGDCWYYFEQNHLMVTGWRQAGGVWYYFNNSGAMVTGWLLENGIWYYLNPDGSMATGWKNIGNTDYYFDGSGVMATGGRYVDGTWYYFAPSGALPYNVNGIIVVNKKHPLPDGYEPGENPQAGAQIRQLIQDMQNMGYNIGSYYSGYRSYATQYSLYWGYVSASGQAGADTYSARPGYSEHQTGLAFDLTYYSGALVDGGAEAAWIAANAHRYGFIVRYQSGKEGITGYMAEPWHLRYVGDAATAIYNSGLTLEEYLGVAGGGY